MVLTQRRLISFPRRSIVINLALILALSAFPHSATATTLAIAPAQASAVSVGNNVIENKDVVDIVKQEQALKIDGSQLMQPINQALKESFEQEYPGTDVTIKTNGTEPALDALIDNDIDLAAIGRSLSAEEKAKGLIEIPVSQDAISIIIGRKNRFKGHLTLEQFAQIFRGEITDWSEVGGIPGPIRFIDRPISSDTRAVLSTYGILGASEQAQGEQAVKLKIDDTAEVIRQLGSDGISYAIASQVQGQRRVKPIKMAILQDTLPGEQAYPYSQVRGYAYKQDNAKAVLPFVNWVSGEAGTAAIGAGKTAEAAAVATALNPPVLAKGATDVAATPGTSKFGRIGIIPWLLGLLPLAVLFLVGRRRDTETTSETVTAAAKSKVETKPTAPVTAKTTAPLAAKPKVETKPAIKPDVAPGKPTAPIPVKPEEKTAEPTLSAQAYYDQGWQLIESHKFADAVTAFDQALKVDPNWMLAWIGKGTALFKLGQYGDAIASFDNGLPWLNSQTITAIPGGLLFVTTAWLNRGRARLKLGQLESALGDFDQALQLDKDSVDALRAKGDVLMQLGRQSEGDACYAQTNTLLNPPPKTPVVDKPEPQQPKGVPISETNKVTKSPPTITKPIATTPGTTLLITPFEETADWNDANAVAQKGLDYVKSGQTSKAESYFKRALELSPINLLGLIGLGNIFLELDQGENALVQFNRAIEIDSNSIDGWIGKGKTSIFLGQAESALGDFDRALQLNKTSVDALKAKGDAFLALDQPEEANRWYSEANSLLNGTPIPTWKPGSKDTQTFANQAAPTAPADKVEDKSPADEEATGKATKPADTTDVVAPDSTDSSTSIATIQQLVNWNDPDAICQKGLDYQNSGRLNEAEYCFQRVLELSPTNVIALINLGQMLLKSGQANDALTQFNRAVELDPNLSNAWIGQGDALVLLGRNDEGKQSYARAAGIGSKTSPETPVENPVDTPQSQQPVNQTPLNPAIVNQPVPPVPVTRVPIEPPAPASFVAPSTPQLLDMVILVDSQAPLKADVTEMERVMAAAIAAASTNRPTDVRVTWLGTHGHWAGTLVQQSVSEYLGSLGKGFESTSDSPMSSAGAIAAVTRNFDWRPGAAQSLLYLGNDSLNKDSQSDDKTAVQLTIQAANETGSSINTYLINASTHNTVATTAEYKELAMATGGVAFVKDSSIPVRDVLEQTLEQSCRECAYRRLTIRSNSDCLVLEQAQLDRLQSLGNSIPLSPGSYIIRINSGTFSYWPDAPMFEPEPWVMLWIYGGRFINQATNIAVGATWVTLNGYDDALKLEVLEGTNLCALFLDTYKYDNVGQIILSILEAD